MGASGDMRHGAVHAELKRLEVSPSKNDTGGNKVSGSGGNMKKKPKKDTKRDKLRPDFE